MTTIKLTVSNHLEAALNTLLELEGTRIVKQTDYGKFLIETSHKDSDALTTAREHLEAAQREIQMTRCDLQDKLDRL